MKYFDKTSDKMTMQEKFDYVKNHFRYLTMNSWNSDKNIANNVKLYNLGLTKKQFNFALDFLFDENASNDFFNDVHYAIMDSDFTAFFDGRTNGYLILGREYIVNEDIYSYDSYLEAKSELDKDGGKDYTKSNVNDDFNLVQSFDRLCDDIRDLLIYYCDNYELGEEKYTIERTRKILIPKEAENEG